MQLLGSTGFTSVILFTAMALSVRIAQAEPSPAGHFRAPATQPVPSPQLSAADVVKAVIDALGSNDANDTGIKITFSFASPGNKEVTGPIEHFIPMLKNPLYEPMLNHRSATFKRLGGDASHVQELVTLITQDGSKVYYVFKDCWMTDGVQRVEPAAGDPSTQPAKPTDLPAGQEPA